MSRPQEPAYMSWVMPLVAAAAIVVAVTVVGTMAMGVYALAHFD